MYYKHIENILTEQQLQELLFYWVEKLDMQQWDISIRLYTTDVRTDEGTSKWSWQYLTGAIEIMNPDMYKRQKPFDMEQTLVHELLHGKFAGFEPLEDNELQEQCIESLSRTLVQLKREANYVQT
jgi:hypothetical protein